MSSTCLSLLNLSYVKRWVIAPMLREQSVAEHTFRVMALTRCLAYGVNMADKETATALLIAMDHDIDEVFTGDVPGTYKDSVHGKNWPDPSRLTRPEVLVKVADALETWSYYMVWGSNDWIHPTRFEPAGRDVQKIHHYTRDWPELLEVVKVILRDVFHLFMKGVSDPLGDERHG